MKLKKLVVLGMAAAMAAAVTGCSSGGDTATNAAAEVTTAAETEETTAEETEAETETEAAETEAAAEEEAEDEENYDTGDASLDNPRNQDEIGESELLVASFGTSYNDNRRLTIGAIERLYEPDYHRPCERPGRRSHRQHDGGLQPRHRQRRENPCDPANAFDGRAGVQRRGKRGCRIF